MTERLELELDVFNVAGSLDQDVHQLLDLLPDFSRDFVLRIVDHGSHDETEEVARELVRRYPQVQFHRADAKPKDWDGHRRRITVRGTPLITERLGRWLSQLFGPTDFPNGGVSCEMQPRCSAANLRLDPPSPRPAHCDVPVASQGSAHVVLRRRPRKS